MIEKTALLCAALLTALASNAFAHGDAAHSAAKIDYSKAEEKAFGKAADPKRATRTIKIDMSDAMRFTPAEFTVKRGEIVRLAVTNSGKTMHELVLGTMAELKEHGELMKKFPGMEHDELHMAHVAPGKTEQIGWRFSKAGEFYYGCLIPGHFDSGMMGKVIVN